MSTTPTGGSSEIGHIVNSNRLASINSSLSSGSEPVVTSAFSGQSEVQTLEESPGNSSTAEAFEPRILYVIGQLRRGGAEQQLYYLLKYLKPRARVVALSEGGYWADEIRELGIEVDELRRAGGWDISRLLALTRIARDYKPDIIHIFLDNVPGLYARLAAVFTGNYRVVSGERADAALQQPSWYRSLKRLLNRRVAAVVCNSQSNYRFLLSEKISTADKLSCIPNGLELDQFKRSDSRLNTVDDGKRSFVVGTVGSLVVEKSPDVFIKTAARVLRDDPSISFVHVGEGALRPQMETLVSSLGIGDRFQFLGQCNEVPTVLATMDLFVLTSNTEGLPNAVMEAMAAGLPCVVTDAGGCSEVVRDGETGFVVSIGDVEQLADRIMTLKRDHELRLSMGKKGQEEVSRFGVNQMAEQYNQLYRRVLQS